MMLVSAESGRGQREAIVAWWKGEGAARSRLADLSLPVLVANGVREVMIPAEHSFAIARTAPNAKLVLYPDAGTRFYSSTSKSSPEKYWHSYDLSFLYAQTIDQTSFSFVGSREARENSKRLLKLSLVECTLTTSRSVQKGKTRQKLMQG